MKKLLNILMLFFSAGTLVCCALPALIAVILGSGALFAVIDSIPFIVVISEYKVSILLASLVLICYNIYNLWFNPNRICPIDQKEACESASKFSKAATVFAAIVVIIGIVTAYL